MEPSARSYSPNGAGQPRKRAARSGRRAAPSGSPATGAVATRTAPPRVEHPAAPAVSSLAPVEAEPAAAAATEVAEAGPVVGIEDFEEIFTRFQTPLTNFIYRLVGNREQAYDLAQDVFVKAYRALSSGTTIQAAALSSWLYRIASNTATDALRRRRLISWLPLSLFNEDRGVGAGMPGADNTMPIQQPSLADEALPGGMGAFANGYDGGRFEQRVADREIVERVLTRLPDKYRACLLLYEHEGFSCAEIAEFLSVSPSAVKMRLMRARERFIALYKEETGKEETGER
jgi:RNA polymerase sigma-70 factor (ECF subfamily)